MTKLIAQYPNSMSTKFTGRYVYQAIERVWEIDEYPSYFFDEKGQFYRFTKRGDVKRLPRTVKRYTQGYTLNSRFFSLAQLRLLLKRHLHPGL